MKRWLSGRCRSWLSLVALMVILLLASLPVLAEVTKPADAPEIRARSAILMEAQGGKILLEKDPHVRLPMASVTKIMTMVLALEALRDGKVRLEDTVTGSALAKSMGGTQIWLEEGEQMSFKDMLYAVAVGSANDCAVAIAEHLAGSVENFVQQMNQKAASLGMKGTHFANPTGLDDPENYSTAYDLALLSRYAISLPMFLQLTSTWDYYVRKGTPKEVWLTTFNKLLKQYPGYDGIKTGFTDEAKYCLVATAKKEGLRLIAVVLGAPTAKDRTTTVRQLLDYGFRVYEAQLVAKGGTVAGEFSVRRGSVDRVPVLVKEDLYAAVPRGTKVTYQKEILLSRPLVAPLKKGQVVGKMVARAGEQVVGEVDLVIAQDVPRGSFGQLLMQTMRQVLQSLTGKKK